MYRSLRFFHSLILVSALVFSASIITAEKPNVIVITADDLGYGDLSCYGAKAFQTPHIDKLAQEGRRFTSGHATKSTCTSTRFWLP